MTDDVDREAMQAMLAATPPMSAKGEPPADDPELVEMALKGLDDAHILQQTVTLAAGFGPVVRVDFYRGEADRAHPMRSVVFRLPGDNFHAVSFIASEADDLDALRASAA